MILAQIAWCVPEMADFCISRTTGLVPEHSNRIALLLHDRGGLMLVDVARSLLEPQR